MTPEPALTRLRVALTMFVPDGFRDEDGVWHEGPHRANALEALAALERQEQELRRVHAERTANVRAMNARLTDRLEGAERRLAEKDEALRGVSNRVDGDGKLCWCADELRSGLFANKHALWCVNAREALRAEPAKKETPPEGVPAKDEG